MFDMCTVEALSEGSSKTSEFFACAPVLGRF